MSSEEYQTSPKKPRDYHRVERENGQSKIILEDDSRILAILEPDNDEKTIWSGLRDNSNYYDGSEEGTVEYLMNEIGIKDDYDFTVEATQEALKEVLEGEEEETSDMSSSRKAEKKTDHLY